MLIAEEYGIRKLATPGDTGICPICKEDVIAKCGPEKIRHWAHVSKKECDSWSEPMSLWHSLFQELFPESCREIVIGNHRADILYKNLVVELQYSSISLNKILEREAFYRKMIWILSAHDFGGLFNFYLKIGYYGHYNSFRWRYGRKKWGHSTKQIYIDFSESTDFHIKKEGYLKEGRVDYGKRYHDIFKINRIYTDGKVAGWGQFISKKQLLRIIGLPKEYIDSLNLQEEDPISLPEKQLKLSFG